MITAIALRRFRHDGTEYAKGDRLDLAPDQFASWRAVGLVAKPRPEKQDKPTKA